MKGRLRLTYEVRQNEREQKRGKNMDGSYGTVTVNSLTDPINQSINLDGGSTIHCEE
jgi:hypothetical protein